MPDETATDLCVQLLTNRRQDGRFVMDLEGLRAAMGLGWQEIHAAVALAIEFAWVRHSDDGVELRATGIYVAKRQLDLA
jgi:hypothetical protein